MNDITNIDDIKKFVDGFYNLVRSDDILAPVFSLRIPEDNWDKHLSRMYDFWNTVLFFEQSYKGNPFAKHIGLPVEAKHFLRWTEMFKSVIDENFEGPVADDTKRRADNMAHMFMRKIAMLKENPKYRSIM